VKYAFFASGFLALAGLALAQDPQPESIDRLRLFQRDLPLIEFFVKEGVKLSGEDNPLTRAQACGGVAAKLVREIKAAGVARDEQRATNLGKYLHAVLVRGVANNLDTARSRLPEDGEPHPDFQRISDEILRVTEPVSGGGGTQASEKQIMQPAAAAVNQGRAAVRDAVKGKRTKP
jgi:hypothetical protein